MKFSAYITLTMVVALSAVQAASAQDARGQRFNFAPNIWKAEHANIPKGYGDYVEPAHNVKAGSMPTKSFLGLDPMMLSKPAAQPPVTPSTEVAARTRTQPKGEFSPAFGKPVLAQLPVIPQAATAKPYLPIKPATAAPARAAERPVVSARRSVSATLRAPKYAHPESATPHVASYSDGFGYSSGPQLLNSGGGNAKATVKAKLLHQ